MPEHIDIAEQDEVLDKSAALDSAPAAEPVVDDEKPLSIRDSLAKAMQEQKEKAELDKPEQIAKPSKNANRIRNPDGTLAPGKLEATVTAKADPAVTAQTPAAINAPTYLKPEVKAAWNELPPKFQSMWAEREKEVEKIVTRVDEERHFGRTLKGTIDPYMPMIRSEGSDPEKAIASLLNTAHVLRTASPQHKGQLLLQLAQQFGADLSVGNQQQPQRIDPVVQQTWQELQALKTERANELRLREQQETDRLNSEVQTFAAKPTSVHFETVKTHMMALIKGGLASGNTEQEVLQNAYDQAVHANPQTRSILLAAQNTANDAKRVADQKAKADAARKAGSSLRGTPNRTASVNGTLPTGNLRQTLEAAFAAQREG